MLAGGRSVKFKCRSMTDRATPWRCDEINEGLAFHISEWVRGYIVGSTFAWLAEKHGIFKLQFND